jgi:hypothetical protein
MLAGTGTAWLRGAGRKVLLRAMTGDTDEDAAVPLDPGRCWAKLELEGPGSPMLGPY